MEISPTPPARDPTLAGFLSRLAEAFEAADVGPESRSALGRVWGALGAAGGGEGSAPARLPVCAHLDAALETAGRAAPPFAELAKAFAELEPSLAWARRPAGGPFASENWPDGHANAMIAGPKGLEDRADIAIGASLLAPDVRYPDHHHGPEEVYLVLSPGRFRHGGSGWFEPGIGGTLYNEPDILHAMASDEAPLLAFWCLWSGHSA